MNNRNLSAIALVATLIALSACNKREHSPEQIAYEKQLKQCRTELDKSEKVPIIGGGYVDMSRFGFVGSSVRYEDGQCGTDILELSFWWTGEEILPDNPKFLKIKRTEIPETWRYFNVAAKLGNQRKAHECRENIDLPQCAGFKGAVKPGWKVTEWPAELTIKLKNYPGLEIWLEAPPPSAENRLRFDDFVMVDWRRPDGTPRSIDCWGLGLSSAKKRGLGRENLAIMTREELENIDFRGRFGHGLPCQVEFWSFGFKGGAARVSTGTEALREAPKALEAINKYISESIVMEDEL
ncbi:MAG: hypothetical protein ACREXR_01835 [Gammaproteobacteria bacterium]